MNYIKAKTWNGKDLKGIWQFNWKIDGVRVLWDNKMQMPVSRAGKPFIGLHLGLTKKALAKLQRYGDCEFFVDDWNTSVSIARTEEFTKPVTEQELYPLVDVDPRLVSYSHENPKAELIERGLKVALASGYEGLILRQGDKWLRVKPKLTADVKVLDVVRGTGKHCHRMGALVTTMGKVGTGFSDQGREDLWDTFLTESMDGEDSPFPIGRLIEIEFTELTKNGLPRFPRFKRFRFDKDTESVDI